jgi:sorbitol-specific phosphotransferase system component IIBC
MQMTPTERDTYLEGIRQRRLVVVERHKKAQEIKKKAANERTVADLSKQNDMLAKDIEKLDKLLVKVEERAAKVAALTIMAEAENDENE